MMAMKSISESCSRLTALGELKALLHNLITGEIRTSIRKLSDEVGNAHG